MSNRASIWNLVLSLVTYVLFMIVVLSAIGFGVGAVELTIWLGLLVLGILLIVRRNRIARAAIGDPSGA